MIDLQHRCQWRALTLTRALSICEASARCAGVTRDNGIVCNSTRMHYELRTFPFVSESFKPMYPHSPRAKKCIGIVGFGKYDSQVLASPPPLARTVYIHPCTQLVRFRIVEYKGHWNITTRVCDIVLHVT